ncbi:MAG: hypothetical protein KKE02_24485 [Alphaproteobacteria bacterium]|nr:hypothetical protein [Alphaproteobacteria bacterium]MBU1516468.1 hypothetical protein [Alphaproteobacteria bacterium]MBU2094225.1 hypothetical protein [Alphaproteobacteria bacterium]MBU2154198.1 hypothetical protein [Alphaproteobacteria bacterium]MBU2307395.1 hypothetical protein [Alphaproteobacteria bacterium]
MTNAGGHTERVRQRTHEGFLRHKGFRWAQIATLLCLVMVAIYFFVAARISEPPSGGSWLGYTLGTMSAGLIVWLACLGIRKRVITAGHYSLKAWVSAHVYLGLSLTVLATLHTGFQFGWNIHTLAYVLMMLVIASGALGIWAYATLPQRLHGNRGETTRKQMLEALESLDKQLHDLGQPLDRAGAQVVRLSLEGTQLGGGFWRRLTGSYGDCANLRAMQKLKTLPEAPNPRIAEIQAKIETVMQQKADVLGLARRQMQITAVLEGWLFVHIPATFALLAALTAHVISVFTYW